MASPISPRHLFDGICWFPLRTQTLPPATHTNAWLLGTGQRLLLDPGCADADQQQGLVDWFAEHPEADLVAIVLSHHHADHVAGAEALARAMGVPIWAHERTASALPRLSVDRFLKDGELIEVRGPHPQRWRVMVTPGHAPGHVCLYEPSLGALVLGDMAAGEGTILIARRDGGDMSEYLRQLERLEKLHASIGLPAHGSVIDTPSRKLRELREHRLSREAMVVEALLGFGAGASMADLLPIVYSDTPKLAWPLATLSLMAHLDKLVADGKVERVERDRFRLLVER